MACLEACSAGLVSKARAIASSSVQVFDEVSEPGATPVKEARSNPKVRIRKDLLFKCIINSRSIVLFVSEKAL
jgi:hypothetical protein